MKAAPIDTGDIVLHRPTGEEWIVAYVRGEYLAWCGWPEGEAKLSDCTLNEKATPEARLSLLREMARLSHDRRGSMARAALEAEGAAL